jgi:hypothetical protein
MTIEAPSTYTADPSPSAAFEIEMNVECSKSTADPPLIR